MKNNFKKALEEAYGFENPSRKEEFFQSIHKNNKPVPFYIKALRYCAVPVTAAIAVLIFTGFVSSNSDVKNEFVSVSESAVSTSCYDNYDNEDIIADTQIVTTAEAEKSKTTMAVTSASSVTKTTSSLPADSSYVIYHEDASQDNHAHTSDTKNTEPTDAAVTIKTTAKTTTTTKTTIEAPATVPTSSTPGTAWELSPSMTQTTEPWQDVVVAPSTTPAPATDPNDYNQSTRDMRVTPSVVYSKTDNIIDVTNAMSNSKPIYPLSWIDSVQSSASAVIYGTVEDIYYTSVDGKPYIQADILVNYSMRYGDFYYGDRISVYIPGGYMSLSDFISSHKWFEYELSDMLNTDINECTAFYNNGNADILSKGSKFLFFLKYGYGDMPDGAFTLCSNMDIYRKSGSRFICVKDSSISFTAKELEEYFY